MEKGITIREGKMGAIVKDNGSVTIMQKDLVDDSQMNRIYMTADEVLKFAEEIKMAQREFEAKK